MADDAHSMPARMPHSPPTGDDAKVRVERYLGRLGELYDEIATRHALLPAWAEACARR
jgi:hypothetical protein